MSVAQVRPRDGIGIELSRSWFDDVTPGFSLVSRDGYEMDLLRMRARKYLAERFAMEMFHWRGGYLSEGGRFWVFCGTQL